MGRTVKKLSNLEIDEVSLVDRPANQHGLVAIAKSYQEDNMAVFDANGDEVFEEELSNGDLVYDEQGNEYVFTDGDTEGDDGGYDEGDDVEKATYGPLRRGDVVGRTARAVRSSRVGGGAEYRGQHARYLGHEYAQHYKAKARSGAQAVGRAGRATGEHLSNNRYAYGGGAAAAGVGAGAGEYHGRRSTASKSLGDEVLSELSKALTEGDRDAVIAKALDQVGYIAARNEELEDVVAELIAGQQIEGFGELAKSYQLGVDDDEFAGVLYRASQVLDPEDLDVLDRVLTGAGQISKAYFDELGVQGYSEGSALEEVYSIAGNAVVKGAELGLSEEQAVTAVFDTNPAAYDLYEAEQRMR